MNSNGDSRKLTINEVLESYKSSNRQIPSHLEARARCLLELGRKFANELQIRDESKTYQKSNRVEDFVQTILSPGFTPENLHQLNIDFAEYFELYIALTKSLYDYGIIPRKHLFDIISWYRSQIFPDENCTLQKELYEHPVKFIINSLPEESIFIFADIIYLNMMLSQRDDFPPAERLSLLGKIFVSSITSEKEIVDIRNDNILFDSVVKAYNQIVEMFWREAFDYRFQSDALEHPEAQKVENFQSGTESQNETLFSEMRELSHFNLIEDYLIQFNSHQHFMVATPNAESDYLCDRIISNKLSYAALEDCLKQLDIDRLSALYQKLCFYYCGGSILNAKTLLEINDLLKKFTASSKKVNKLRDKSEVIFKKLGKVNRSILFSLLNQIILLLTRNQTLHRFGKLFLRWYIFPILYKPDFYNDEMHLIMAHKNIKGKKKDKEAAMLVFFNYEDTLIKMLEVMIGPDVWKSFKRI